MAAKVATDLKRMQRFYGAPNDSDIAQYEAEVIDLLKAGYLGTLTIGFRRDGKWIEPTLRYTARDLAGASANDDDPGSIKPGANIDGASFYNYLTYSSAWDALSAAEQDAFKRRMPFYRAGATEPAVNGYLADDRVYSAGGRALNRASVRSYLMSSKAALDELFERRISYPDFEPQERLARLVGLDAQKTRLTKILSLLVNPARSGSMGPQTPCGGGWTAQFCFAPPAPCRTGGGRGFGKDRTGGNNRRRRRTARKHRNNAIPAQFVNAWPRPRRRDDATAFGSIRSYGRRSSPS